jgi:hypothetical protein
MKIVGFLIIVFELTVTTKVSYFLIKDSKMSAILPVLSSKIDFLTKRSLFLV